jgi:ABC-type Fe3+/spermidine/putrescine transport system ATPase subunit
MLKLDGLSFSYDENRIFDDFSHQFKKGEITAIVGKSGVGKSTLFAILSGLSKPNQGIITLDGVDLSDLPSNQRPIISMFQQESLFPHMTIYENIRFPLISKFNKERFKDIDHKKYIEKKLKEVNLEGFENRYPATLSGGQKQRATLARSLAAKPKILLLDEPFSALNKELKNTLNIELKEIVKSNGIIALKITHDIDEALNFSNNILYLGEKQNFKFKNINLDKLIAPAQVIYYFQLGILNDDKKSYYPLASLKEEETEDDVSFECKIITSISRGKITEYTLQYQTQKFKFYGDKSNDKQIILHACEEDRVSTA